MEPSDNIACQLSADLEVNRLKTTMILIVRQGGVLPESRDGAWHLETIEPQ